MNIVVIGNDAAFTECQSRLGKTHSLIRIESVGKDSTALKEADVVFDFSTAFQPANLQQYSYLGIPVFINTVFTTLATVTHDLPQKANLIGFCGLPGFFDREVLEVVTFDVQSTLALAQPLGMKITAVKDQTGMVTPRVVGMIINEAFEALQQQVASKEDIDLSMKLGTNYPYGPFEWAERIGQNAVRNLLQSVYQSTGDARYKPNF